MALKQLSIRVDEKTLKALKKQAFETETSQQSLVDRYIMEGIERDKNQLKLDVDAE